MGISNTAMTIAAWDPSKHPRAAAGSAGGGQFAPLSYNAKSNTGTGYGKKGGDDRVKAAQQALNKAGMTDMNGKKLLIDGKLGPKTTASIKAYQRKHGLKPDGKITPALLAQLKKGGSPGPGKGKTVHKKAALKRAGSARKAPVIPRRAASPDSRYPAMR